jgi:hypothetical protein
MEEYLSCGMYLMSAAIGFERVADGVTPVSRMKLPLPKIEVVRKVDEDDVQFLATVELDVEGVVGSYTCPEHDACIASLRNRGWLNHVFELVGVACGSHLVPGIDAFTEASKKKENGCCCENPA